MARISTALTIDEDISVLKSGNYDFTNVLVNRYDGIDLADNNCRILIMIQSHMQKVFLTDIKR